MDYLPEGLLFSPIKLIIFLAKHILTSNLMIDLRLNVLLLKKINIKMTK